MAVSVEERVGTLEQQVGRMATQSGDTFVLPLAVLGAFALFLMVVSQVPLAEVQQHSRAGAGVVAGVAGLLLLTGAMGFVRFALRALVELAVVCTALLNALAMFGAWVMAAPLAKPLVEWGVVQGQDVQLAVPFVVAVVLLLVNVLLAVVLYPLAKIAGSTLAD